MGMGRRVTARVRSVLMAVVLFAMVYAVLPSHAAAPSDGWLVSWGSKPPASQRHKELSRLGYIEKKFYPLSNVSWVKAIADTAATPDGRFSPNYLGRIFATTPNDPPFTTLPATGIAQQYINLPAAWDYQQGSSNVRIAVLDSGIDTGHADLDANIEKAVSYVTGDAYAGDKNGHGTQVAALIAAEANNGVGIAGVCWSCKILSVKVANNSGVVALADLAEGIRYATSENVHIINMSVGFKEFGTNDPGTVLKSAVEQAHNQGILLVGAAGDSNANSMAYPARYDQVMAVGAIDSTTGSRWSNSNYKDDLEIMAPGVSMFSDSFGGAGPVSVGDGTSFAAALVSGVAGLIWSQQPTLTRDEVRGRLNGTAKDLNTPGRDDETGNGSVDAGAALRVAAYQVAGGKDVITYPNPFRVHQGGTVKIRPPQDVGPLTIRLYSLDGRHLRTITGTNEVTWDGKTAGGRTVTAGVYLFQAAGTNLRDEGRITVIDWD